MAHGPGSSVLRLLSYHNHLPCPAQFQSLLHSIQLLPSWDYLPLHEGFAEQQLTLPPKAGDCRVDTWRSPRKAGQHWGCGCEIASLPPKISFSPFSSGHKRGPAHVQAAMDGYRKLLWYKRFLNCPISFLKQMEMGGRGRLIVEGSTCCLSSWMFWVMWTIQVECASALKQVFILVVVVTDKQLQFCW